MAKKETTPVEVTVDTELVPCCGKDECTDCVVDKPISVGEAVGTYTAEEGDTYPSIADMFKPVGMSKHDFATYLFVLNSGKAVSAGTVIKL